MTAMRNFEAEAAAAVGHLFHRNHPQTNAQNLNPEVPVSALTEAKAILHDVFAKLESIDEAGQAAVEAISVNPTGVSIVNTVASIAHLPDPDGLLGGVDNMLKVAAAVLVHAAAATAPAEGADEQPAQAPTANVIR